LPARNRAAASTSGVVTGVDLNEAANCRLAAPKRQIRPI